MVEQVCIVKTNCYNEERDEDDEEENHRNIPVQLYPSKRKEEFHS
jgi:hypothetical protein